MQVNRAKARLKAGETIVGCFVRYANAGLVEVLGLLKWDFLVFDAEHGSLEPQDCEQMVRGAELRGVTPIVRVPNNEPSVILRYLETGAHGVHVPMVNTAADAERAVSSVKYPPRGYRGLGGSRAADYTLAAPLSEYVKRANEETMVVIHAETPEAVEQLPEILKVGGIDVVFIGPTDLSQSLGVPGQPQLPQVQGLIHQIIDLVVPTQVAVGIIVGDAQAAQKWRDRGVRYICITLESVLRPATTDFLKFVRG